MRARYYDPSMGRFLSQDTYLYNFQNPIELNRYGYVADNPVKGFSSYQVNQLDIADEYFRWQTSYGCLTYGQKVVPNIIEYVENQKQRHENDEVYDYLERIDSDSKPL